MRVTQIMRAYEQYHPQNIIPYRNQGYPKHPGNITGSVCQRNMANHIICGSLGKRKTTPKRSSIKTDAADSRKAEKINAYRP